ncbi:transcription factor [Niveomyces insectorum RCEF 264]|uniref:Probable endonuclease LCL3 n=1 Tax=Niveomyces insectorum RCEF 264 TaxID=1081102 RepID=A0A167VAT0_9HYPO|nr:transcription factor [Niveomyces insectorum RCEF 264]
MSKVFVANVKSVLSGDTLVLTSPNNPTLERTFSLAFVGAPRLSKDNEEPFAFQSREYLRSLVVGKQVQCTILYTVPSSNRDYGTVLVKDGPKLPDALVEAGWVKVREDAGKKEDNEDSVQRIESMRNAESQARAAGRGLFSGADGSIEVQHDLGGPNFLKEWKGQTVDGIIERVFSGDRLLVRLLLSDKKHAQVVTLVAGIRTPATERVNQASGQTQAAEEYGKEAQQFVETRLLQRQIKIHIVGASPQGQLVATVLHPRGNIAEFLLQEGLARCNDFHSTMLGEGMASLRAAEKAAQAAKKRLHKNHVAKAAESHLDVNVSKVISADTILVRSKTGPEKRIQLSSVRGPRTNDASEAPFRDEAKEFLRKKLIGKHVRVTIDGSRPATDDFEARDVATVTQNGKNVNLALVQEGYASVIRHRKDDTDRAPNYDELLAAQETAKEEKKGMWSGKAPKIKQYVDASETLQRAKIQAATLQRQKKVPGIVDFCKSGSRFTILVPREGIKLTLVLAGIRAPRAPGRNSQDKGEPFGEEALELANRRCNQRDCEIDVFDVDKTGGFIGELYINRESFAKVLVEEGLASVHQYSAEKSGNAAELNAAEQRAKEARKGLWHDWDPSQDEAAAAENGHSNGHANGGAGDAGAAGAEGTTLEKRPQDYRDIVVTNIDANGRLKIQEVGKGTAALETLMSEFRKFHLDSKNNVSLGGANTTPPKAGDYVSARFSLDKEWYRARIRSNDRAAKVAEVVYVDYGNSEKIPWAQLRPLDAARFGPQRLKPQATDAVLSFVQLPTAVDYFRDAVNFIAECTEGRSLVGSFDFVDAKEGLSYITVFDPATGQGDGPDRTESLNREVLLNGHGLVPTKLKAWERSKVFEPTLKALREAEREAKENKYGMWEYGDITED